MTEDRFLASYPDSDSVRVPFHFLFPDHYNPSSQDLRTSQR